MIKFVTETDKMCYGLNVYRNDPASKGFKIKFRTFKTLYFIYCRYSVAHKKWFFVKYSNPII